VDLDGLHKLVVYLEFKQSWVRLVNSDLLSSHNLVSEGIHQLIVISVWIPVLRAEVDFGRCINRSVNIDLSKEISVLGVEVLNLGHSLSCSKIRSSESFYLPGLQRTVLVPKTFSSSA